ncbi:DUF63 family protein [Thermococcus thioreducens]|uniref:Uncharacterized membrane protein n=1 Tax=Thermococcus thioreducens TaxID=277988 RepID=A0A0Q2UN27_9EURY|nr:DUF63 family protein [Thermococcus thioreducens]ASJ12889.1 hypothetical protein A3L14_08335 [Thermococcus thioreducens]KQH82080.1 hypothetical protein AMR53_07615 [Thermococcus thioreducens]SEV83785.1 Uncharacterized membrane protein [Thermococcus thioreducens]
MGLYEFFYEYFIRPIQENQGYNPVNTVVYAVILGVAVIILYRMLKRMGIKVDERFFSALIPYIILGPLMRSMTDVGILPRTYLTVSPGGYFVIAAFAIASLYVVWRHVGPEERFYPLYRDFGWVLLGGLVFVLVINLGKVNFNTEVFKYFIPALIIAEGFIWFVSKKLALVRDNSLLFYTHFYDATTTFVGIQFLGFWEQHVLARWLMDAFGTPAVIYPEKFLILLPIVWILDRWMKDEDPDLINFVKLTMFILGFGPGMRNLLIMLMGG